MVNLAKLSKIPVLFTGIVSRWDLNVRQGLGVILVDLAGHVGVGILKIYPIQNINKYATIR
jgi:hypothetical protein